MNRNTLLSALIVLALPAAASAHVTVSPRESKPGAEEKYTVRVPTEGQVTTTKAVLEVPDGVTVVDVAQGDGVTHEEKRDGTRIVTITWTKEIKAKEAGLFVFTAKNPSAGSQITWKVHQHFADGKVSDWTPATRLVSADLASPAQTGGSAAVETWLRAYDAAFVARDLDKLAAFYHPDVTIYEGGGVTKGWADYRDNHLGPELKQFENLQFAHGNVVVRMIGPDSAYATSEYTLKATMGERQVDSGGLETLVRVKMDDGSWKIRHSHTSSRPRRPAEQGK